MKERGRVEPNRIEPIVERVVSQVLETHVAQLRRDIVRQVTDEVVAEAATAVPSASGASDLARAVAEIQMGSSQREILRALLDTCARYAARVALFVVKGSHATGWQGRGFANNDLVKDFALDGNAPAVVRAMTRAMNRADGGRSEGSAPVSELDSHFLQEFGTPASGEGWILPLILKDKVAALVYADSGTEAAGLFEPGALDLLVLSTCAWLEVNSLRKHAQKDPAAAHTENHHPDSHATPVAGAGASPSPAFNDPFASHAPAFGASHTMAAAAAASAGDALTSVTSAAVDAPTMTAEAHSSSTEVQSAVAEMEPELVEPAPIVDVALVHETVPEIPSAPAIPPEDQDVHRKAKRFARLLVDEIKLYNQAKVAEGRKNKDLYDRLKEAIEKSRVTYQKRYGNSAAASANYFQHEIIRSLAEDDLSIMGGNFRQ